MPLLARDADARTVAARRYRRLSLQRHPCKSRSDEHGPRPRGAFSFSRPGSCRIRSVAAVATESWKDGSDEADPQKPCEEAVRPGARLCHETGIQYPGPFVVARPCSRSGDRSVVAGLDRSYRRDRFCGRAGRCASALGRKTFLRLRNLGPHGLCGMVPGTHRQSTDVQRHRIVTRSRRDSVRCGNMTPFSRCAVCDAELEPWFERLGRAVFRCPACRHIQVTAGVARLANGRSIYEPEHADVFEAHGNKEYYLDEGSHWAAVTKREFVRKFVSSGNLLEVGS